MRKRDKDNAIKINDISSVHNIDSCYQILIKSMVQIYHYKLENVIENNHSPKRSEGFK